MSWTAAAAGHPRYVTTTAIGRRSPARFPLQAARTLGGAACGALRRVWDGGGRADRAALVTGAVLVASGVAHVVVLLATGRTWTGPVSLRKPATFGLSFGLTLAAVTWATTFVPVRPAVRSALLGLLTGASVLEVALVGMQAWRGVPSHFNDETGFDRTVSLTLAAGGAAVVVTVVGFTAAALRSGTPSPSMRLAVRYGLLSLLAGLAVGAVMIADGVGKVRAGDQQLAYTTAGQLRPAHAVALHGILVLPALAWLLGLTGWSERLRLWLVRVAVAAYTLLGAVVAGESAAGVPPLAAPPVPAAASALAVAVLAGVAAAALYGLARRRPAPGA
jgi:hypothetical protein